MAVRRHCCSHTDSVRIEISLTFLTLDSLSKLQQLALDTICWSLSASLHFTHTHEDEERESLLQLNNRKINQCAPIYSLLIYSIHVSLMYESAIGKVKNTIGDNAN